MEMGDVGAVAQRGAGSASSRLFISDIPTYTQCISPVPE